MTFTYKNYNESIPTPGELDKPSLEMLAKVEETFKKVDELLGQCKFKDSIKVIMSLAQEANRYLDDKAPWKAIKVDKAAAGTSLYVVIGVLSGLRTLMYPFLPFSSQKLHEYSGLFRASEGFRMEIPDADRRSKTKFASCPCSSNSKKK